MSEESTKLVGDERRDLDEVRAAAFPSAVRRNARTSAWRRLATGSAALLAGAATFYIVLDEPELQLRSGALSINILLLEADQVRPDAHEASSSDSHRLAAVTTNLDQLAAEGVRFARAYSSTPICTPARLALLTGRSPFRRMRTRARTRPHRPCLSQPHLPGFEPLCGHRWHALVPVAGPATEQEEA